ncbi:MAG: lytic transglycosylase domain-containing protein [Bacteroidetes bacterium]|nr:lytic transglycosylase domain-containing protein [Bacteroidota bacterium]
MKVKVRYIVVIVLLLVFAGAFIFAVIEKKNTTGDYRALFARNYRILTPEIPSEMYFAGEKVPLNLFYIRESLEREITANTFMHSSTIMMFKRAYRWFPVIEPILKKYNIPDDFKYLALAESNLVNNVSPSGAEGYWQFLKATGKKYDLEINDEVDERYNLIKSTEAACQYFLEGYDHFKNWTLVAASYNRGFEGVETALEQQKVNNYYDLYLVDEAARYVFRILALKQIYIYPVKYGLYLLEKDFNPPIPTYTVTIDTGINDLSGFAIRFKINYHILREFNPWIHRYSLPNKTGKSYTFILPKEGSLNYNLLIKNMPDSKTFFHDTIQINEVN